MRRNQGGVREPRNLIRTVLLSLSAVATGGDAQAA